MKKKPQVIFYYPQHFNRSAEGTNPFFDRLLEACDKYGVSYRLYEEPDYGTDKPRNPKARKADVLYWTVLLIRKVVRLFKHSDFYEQEKVVARIVNGLTFGRWSVPIYITISGSMFHLFAYLNPIGRVFDMQHGVLYKSHPTFFDDNSHLRSCYYDNNLNWLFWGRGYEQCFIRGDEEILSGRTHVIGYPMAIDKDTEPLSMPCRNTVLFSLQLTDDFNVDWLEKQKGLFENALYALRGLGIRVLLKHHPRYNNCIPIDDLFDKFDFIELTSKSIQELHHDVMLQVTVYSTTAFEYAALGIPSFFIDPDGQLLHGSLFYEDFHYPLYRHLSLCQVVHRLQDAEFQSQDSIKVRTWYSEFYDAFNEQAFLQIVS